MLESTSNAPVLEFQKEAKVSENKLPEAITTSVWKRTYHLLRLRKPEKWKKQKK